MIWHFIYIYNGGNKYIEEWNNFIRAFEIIMMILYDKTNINENFYHTLIVSMKFSFLVQMNFLHVHQILCNKLRLRLSVRVKISCAAFDLRSYIMPAEHDGGRM